MRGRVSAYTCVRVWVHACARAFRKRSGEKGGDSVNDKIKKLPGTKLYQFREQVKNAI
jgi:hypothetical protein